MGGMIGKKNLKNIKMKLTVIRYLLGLMLIMIYSCEAKGQYEFVKFQTLPLDTAKWSITKILSFDFNNDNLEDVLIEYGRYEDIKRPTGILVPIIICIKNDKDTYLSICKMEDFISLPNYQLKKLNDFSFSIIQQGNRNDYNSYTHVFDYKNGEIYIINEVVTKIITRSKIDDQTDQIINLDPIIDTVHNETIKIKADQYDFREFKGRFSN